MRIGIFSESYEPLLNGVAVSVGTLAKELRSLGHKVYIFAPSCPGEVTDEPDTYRFPSIRTWVDREYPVPIPFFPHIIQKVDRLKLDVIHTQTPWMLGWLGMRIGKRLGIPVVSTNHTRYTEYAHYFPLAPKSVAQSFIIGLMRRYYNKCNGVVVPSTPIMKLLKDYGVKTPIHVIPTGISISGERDPGAREAIRKQYGIPEEGAALLYLGRLAKEKNIELLLESFERLAVEHPETHLLVVGGGQYESACRKKALQLHAANRIVFTGYKSREEVAKYYSAGDIFVFPSTTETQGLVLCEALQAGLPCVAVRAGGSQEMISDGEDGFLTDNNIEDFSSKISILLDDAALRSQFSVKGAENSLRFLPQGMVVRMLEVYESVQSENLSPTLTVKLPV